MGGNTPAESLEAGYRALLGVDPPDSVRESLLAYLDLLSRWNKTYNLTAVRDPAGMVSRHVLDSLSVLPWLEGGTLLDAGTGAGLPGVPLAIVRPELKVTLLDSAGKKIRFLRHVQRELGLGNIFPVQARLEEFVPHAGFAMIISRAFAELSQFALAARHLLEPGTRLLAMKGRLPEEEISHLPAWIRVDRVQELFPPGLHEQRHLVIMSLSE
jgi:16S rRNA (guanine527-N7)-methyltransferase